MERENTLSQAPRYWLLLVPLFVLSGAAWADSDLQRSVKVSGEAEIRVAPDMATVSAEIVVESQSVDDARGEANDVTARALSELERLGIDRSDIDSTSLSIQPQYEWQKDERRQLLRGYRVVRQLKVRVTQLEQLGTILETLAEAGINRVQPPRLSLMDEEAVHQQVLAAAATNARDRAAVITAALGADLGEVLTISTEQSRIPQRMYARAAAMEEMAMDSGAAQTYQAGDLTYRVVIAAEFALR
ncbi:MAG: SIMPL domain-containing protein [Pseudomonadota bacterium]